MKMHNESLERLLTAQGLVAAGLDASHSDASGVVAMSVQADDAARCAGRVGSDSSDETVDASSRRSAICGSAARVFWGERSAPAIEGEGRPDGGLSRVRHDVSLLTKSEHAELWPSQSFAVR